MVPDWWAAKVAHPGQVTAVDQDAKTLSMAIGERSVELPNRYLAAGQLGHGYAMTVYKAELKKTPAKRIAIFGSSAGGALTLEMVLRALRP